MTFLLIDNYDSFTYMLADYLRQCQVTCRVVRNDEPMLRDDAFIEAFDAIVLSPGPKTPSEAGLMMDVMARFYRTKPILGVCLGHQAIGVFFGATLEKAHIPRHGKVDPVSRSEHPLFRDMPETFHVTRYHSLVLTGLDSPLKVIAATHNGEVMALAHNQLPLFGIQFHPESCLTEHGITIIRNYIEIVKRNLS